MTPEERAAAGIERGVDDIELDLEVADERRVVTERRR